MKNFRKRVTRDKGKDEIIFWGILLVAFLLRFVGLGKIPYGVNQDEAMLAMDAWALSKYKTDRYGTFLPVHFTAWKYGQMSVLLAYLMIPFIKILGFSTFSVRLPMMLISTLGVALVYLITRKLFSERLALVAMALTAVNPWQFIQSRWALDCNLFPHAFLLGFYLLLLGLEKRRYLYLSMVCFGLTFYCYGIAIYTVPVFLLVYAAWCLWKRQLRVREIVLCVVIFGIVTLPEIITMVINMFGGSTIETPFFTMCFFPESIRSDDILFLNFSFAQLGRNAMSLLKQVFLQCPDYLFNTLPAFGPLYHISIPFILVGMVQFTQKLFGEQDICKQTAYLAFWGFLLTGIWAGLITKEVNVNRINIIFYAVIIICGYGIEAVVKWFKKYEKRAGRVLLAAYGVCAITFFTSYFTFFAEKIQTYFNVDFLDITARADQLEEYDSLYITGHMDWQYNLTMSEILTQYSCKIDALYYQEKVNETGGRSLLPYSQRYHYVKMEHCDFADDNALYILQIDEVKYLPRNYELVLENASYVAISL